jgi:GPH family glycoside/pentoside/hexuronide:cation symporter
VGWFIGAVGVRINQFLIDTAHSVGGVWGTVLAFREGYAVCAVVFGVITVVTLVWCGFAVHEPKTTHEAHAVGMVEGYLRTLRNRSFLLVIFAFLLASLFESVGFSIFPFLIGFWYYQGDMQAMNLNLQWIMLPLFFVSFPAVLFWTWVSGRIGKKQAVLAGTAASAITLFLHYPMITPLYPNLIWPIMILFGWAIASVNFLISALIPDIVDEEELEMGGRRREGAYFGVQSFVSKLGGALGLLMVGAFLSLIGFQEGAHQQSQFTIDWIRVFFAYFRGAGYAIGFFILLAYPLTEARVHEIRIALTQRNGGAAG